MLSGLEPDQYERVCASIFKSTINIGAWLLLCIFIGCIFGMTFDLVLGISSRENVLLIVALSSLKSFIIVSFCIVHKRVGLKKFPLIYWWVILFGYSEPAERFLRDIGLDLYTYYDKDEVNNRMRQYMKRKNAGLYYLDYESQNKANSIIYFASKKRALQVVLTLGIRDSNDT